MANKKFTDLTNKTTAGASDIVPIVDPADNTSKRTTVAGIAAAVAESIPDDSLTADMIDVATLKPYLQSGVTGTISFVNNGGAGGAINIAFPTPMAGTPSVVATPVGSTGNGLSCHVSNISSTGFTVLGRTSGTTTNGTVQWIAHYNS